MSLRRVLGKLLLVAGTVVVTLLALEIGVRLLGVEVPPPKASLRTFTRYDATLGWSGVPGASGPYRTDDFTVQVTLNSGGWRDDEPPRPEPASARVIALLGDSYSWGFGVERGEMFADRIEEILTDHVVLNLGVPGYGPDQELLLLRAQPDLRPDLVLVQLCLANDLLTVRWKKAYRLWKPQFALAGGSLVPANATIPVTENWERMSWDTSLRNWLGRNLRLYAWVRPRWADLRARLGHVEPYEAPHARVGLLATDPAPEVVEAWVLVEALLEALRDEAAERGAQMAVLAVADPLQVDDAYWEESMRPLEMDARRFDRNLPNRRLRDVADRLGIPLVDPTEALRERAAAGEGLFISHDDPHWNARAHEIVARILSRFLVPQDQAVSATRHPTPDLTPSHPDPHAPSPAGRRRGAP